MMTLDRSLISKRTTH